ncbi:MAG: NAD(P)H-dependent oxidoreductase [Candidatus Magasanikbacteria bacterium]
MQTIFFGIVKELLDVRDYMRLVTIPAWIGDSEETAPWKEKVSKASAAYILILPEYNHSFPGELKIVWDSACSEYFVKKIVVVTVSSGGFGGVRALYSMLPIFQTCQLNVAGSV